MFAQTVNRCSKVFFCYCLDIPYELDRIPFPKQKKRLPVSYTYDEVKTIIANAANLKHRTLLTVIYSSGLRVCEVVRLQPQDIIRDKMVIKIRQSKGAKDRYTILSVIALQLLEKYWNAYRPQKYLFPGYGKNNSLSIRACQHAYEIAKRNAGISKKGGIHTLRHSFATHYLEVGGGLFQLQKFMGHKQIRTTLKYVHLSEEKIIARSPLDVYAESDS